MSENISNWTFSDFSIRYKKVHRQVCITDLWKADGSKASKTQILHLICKLFVLLGKGLKVKRKRVRN